jgi:glycerol-3-phosphate cytidylyltransferase
MRILTIDQAAVMSTDAQKSGKKVVTTNGTFDLLSVAHVRLLEAAKKEGDILIVGVNSDASVKALKGNDRPVVSEEERATLVASLRAVDAVFLFDDADPRVWLSVIKPDVHVNSEEYGKECVEAETVREIGAKLVLAPRATDIKSTSKRIEDIVQRFS